MTMPIPLLGQVRGGLGCAGWMDDDIRWAEALRCPVSAHIGTQEVIFAICKSGMRFLVARRLWRESAAGVLKSRTLAVSAATPFPEEAGAGASRPAAGRDAAFRLRAICGADPGAPVIPEMLHGSLVPRSQNAPVSMRTLLEMQHEERR